MVKGHIEHKILRYIQNRHKSRVLSFKKINLPSFDLQGHGQGRGQGHRRVVKEKF